MSPHRLHYLQLNPDEGMVHLLDHSLRPATRQRRAGVDMGAVIILALMVFFTILLGVYTIAQALAEKSQATALPVRTPVVQVFELPPISVDEARIEGFRAGMATAAEEGCSARALSQPIATE